MKVAKDLSSWSHARGRRQLIGDIADISSFASRGHFRILERHRTPGSLEDVGDCVPAAHCSPECSGSGTATSGSTFTQLRRCWWAQRI